MPASSASFSIAFHEGQALGLHDEGDDIAANAGREAFENLLLIIDVEAGRFLIGERRQADPFLACFFSFTLRPITSDGRRFALSTRQQSLQGCEWGRSWTRRIARRRRAARSRPRLRIHQAGGSQTDRIHGRSATSRDKKTLKNSTCSIKFGTDLGNRYSSMHRGVCSGLRWMKISEI